MDIFISFRRPWETTSRTSEKRVDRNRSDRNQILRKTSVAGWPLSFRATFLATFLRLDFRFDVNPIIAVKSLRHWQYNGIKKSVKGARNALSRLGLSLRSGAKDAARDAWRISRFTPSALSLSLSLSRPAASWLFRTRSNLGVRSRSSVYAIDAFVHRAMSIIVCPSVCLFTE